MAAEGYRDTFAGVVGFTTMPVLVAVGLAALMACALRGQWREGVSLALAFWLAAGLLKLAVATTWHAIGAAAIIVTVRHLVTWALNRDRAAQAG